jgi:C-terminal processing protease CtpA/Prc
MNRLFARPILFVALLLSVFAVTSAEDPKCHAPNAECERMIRQMLAGRRYLGIQIADMRPGVIIKAVIPSSPASRAGLDTGDRLISINGKSVVNASAGDVKALLHAAATRTTGTVALTIQRRGAFRKTEARLEAYPKEHVDKVIANHLSLSHTATAGAQP